MIQVKFNDKAKQVLADTLDLSGGVVVTELPTVGEPHTIYELQETSKASYGWVFSGIPSHNGLSDYFLVFDTYEQMTTTINAIQIDEDTLDEDYYAYIRDTNQMYRFVISPVLEGEDPYWVFEEQQKKEDESGTYYAFQLDNLERYQTFYILKEFVGNERPVADGGWEYTYLTLDNKEVYIGHEGFGYILSDIVSPNYVGVRAFVSARATVISNKLLNSVELEEGYYNLLRATGGDNIVCYNTSDNKYYALVVDGVDYYWYYNPENREYCYFAQMQEEVPGQEPPHYVGELEWNELPVDELPNYNEIPYDDIINIKLEDPLWMFKPKKGGEVTSTYWIYTNGEWMNIDDISVPSTSLGVIYSNIRIDNPNVNNAVDIYYGEEKLEINDYYVFYPQTEEPEPTVAYAIVSGLPQLTSETHDFVLTIHPKVIVDTSNDKLVIDVNGRNVYESSWQQTIPSEITVIVEGISQISIVVKDLPL